MIIVLIISVLIISNTVRLTIYAKKELIKSFQLVGATRAFIKSPFMLEGVFHGLIGALVATLLLYTTIRARYRICEAYVRMSPKYYRDQRFK